MATLAEYKLIVALDLGGGIAKDGRVPWSSMTDGIFVRDTTVGNGKNAVIMGRKTYEGIPMERKPLAERSVYVISRSWRQEDHVEVTICESILDALVQTGSKVYQYENVFILGGEMVYATVLKSYLYLCKSIYVTKFRMNYECDQHFDYDMVKDFHQFSPPQNTQDYIRYFYEPRIVHPEYALLNLLRKVSDQGKSKKTSGVLVKELFGETLRIGVDDRLPIITTRLMDYNEIFRELLFWLSGETQHPECVPLPSTSEPNTIYSSLPYFAETAHIKKKVFEDRYERGDYGPYEGFQLRHHNAVYTDSDEKYGGDDQISYLTTTLQETPSSHKIVCGLWSLSSYASQLQHPQVLSIQLSSTDGTLDILVSMRECNVFADLPLLITKFAMLLAMFAHIAGSKTGDVIFHFGHVFINSVDLSNVDKQCNRTPRPFPFYSFRRAARLKQLDDFTTDSFLIEAYSSWPGITPKYPK